MTDISVTTVIGLLRVATLGIPENGRLRAILNMAADLLEEQYLELEAVGAGGVQESFFDPKDLVIETFPFRSKSGGFGSIPCNGVRITHKPSGIWAEEQDYRTQHANKSAALKTLELLVKAGTTLVKAATTNKPQTAAAGAPKPEAELLQTLEIIGQYTGEGPATTDWRGIVRHLGEEAREALKSYKSAATAQKGGSV